MRLHQGRPVVALEGVETMNDGRGAGRRGAADAGVGRLPPLPRGHVLSSTISWAARCGREAGRAIGRVTAVDGPMERSRLVVARPRGEMLIPLVDGYLRGACDPAAQRIVGRIRRDGLLELNDDATNGGASVSAGGHEDSTSSRSFRGWSRRRSRRAIVGRAHRARV